MCVKYGQYPLVHSLADGPSGKEIATRERSDLSLIRGARSDRRPAGSFGHAVSR